MNNALPRGRTRRDQRRARFAGVLALSTALMTGGALSAMAAPAAAPAAAPVVHGVAVTGNGQLRADGLFYTFALNVRATNAATGAGATGGCTVAGGGALAAGCTSVSSVTRGTGASANTATITGTARTLFNQRVGFRMVVVDRANPNGAGRDTVALTINGRTTQATVTRGNITIADTTPTTPPPPANHAPVAQNDSYSTTQSKSLTVGGPGVLGNDTDLDGDQLHAQVSVDPAHGSLTLNDDGSFTYSPLPFYVGSDSFTYTTTDGKGATSAPATVTVAVNPGHVPVAYDDSYTTPEDTPLDVAAPGFLANDTDSDGDQLYSDGLDTQPEHGQVTFEYNGHFRYTPHTGYSGTDSFRYRVNDGAQGSTTAIVTITVTPVNHAPVAHDDSYTTTQGKPLRANAPGVLGNDTDPDGDALTLHIVSGPAHGEFGIAPTGEFFYAPDAGYSGTDSFTYTVGDGNGATSAPATVTLTVNPANRAPVAHDDTYTYGAFFDNSLGESRPLIVNGPGVLGKRH